MVAVTYDTGRAAAPTTADKASGQPHKSFFMRLAEAIERSQMQRAERDLARYRHLLPLDYELRSGNLVRHSQEKLPFGGW